MAQFLNPCLICLVLIWQTTLCRALLPYSLDYVTRECDAHLKQLDSIEKFREFLHHYRAILHHVKKPKKGIFNLDGNLRKCYELEQPLNDLELILDYQASGVCRMAFIEKMVEFHMRYLTKDPIVQDRNEEEHVSQTRSKFPFVGYFFSLLAHQVGLECKKKLMDRLREADQAHSCSNLLNEFMPMSDESMPRIMDTFHRVEDFTILTNFKNPELAMPQPRLKVLVPNSTVKRVERLQDMCSARKSHYTNLFAPIASLAQLGYSTDGLSWPTKPENESEQRLLSCWLAASQLCQGILRSQLQVKTDVEVDPALNAKMISIEWVNDSSSVEANSDRSTEQMYIDTIDEISPEVVSVVKRKSTGFEKMKSKAFGWLKSYIEKRLNLQGAQHELGKRIIEALTDEHSQVDSKVGFAGERFYGKRYNPTSIITDHADFIVKLTSLMWNKEIGLLISCVVGVVMSAVFVWFSLYALVTYLKNTLVPMDENTMKACWTNLRDEKVARIRSKVEKKKNKITLASYRPV